MYLFFVFGFFMIIEEWEDSSVKNTEKYFCTFTKYSLKGNAIRLYSDEYKDYFEVDLSLKKSPEKMEQLKDSCDGITRFCIYAKHTDFYYIVVNMSDDEGNIYITFNQVNKRNKIFYFTIIVTAVILWTVFVVFSIIVGRYPERFHPKIVSGLWGDNIDKCTAESFK